VEPWPTHRPPHSHAVVSSPQPEWHPPVLIPLSTCDKIILFLILHRDVIKEREASILIHILLLTRFGCVEVNSSSSLALESDTFSEKGDRMVLLKARTP